MWLRSKESACNAGYRGSIPGLGRSPGSGNGNPPPVFLPGESHGQRSLVNFSRWGLKELDTTEGLTHTMKWNRSIRQASDGCVICLRREEMLCDHNSLWTRTGGGKTPAPIYSITTWPHWHKVQILAQHPVHYLGPLHFQQFQ